MYIDIAHVSAGYRHTAYEKEAQVNEIVNQPQLSSSLVIEKYMSRTLKNSFSYKFNRSKFTAL